MTTTRPDTVSRRQLVRDASALLLVFGVVAAVAFAMAQPWLPRPLPGGPALNRYVPLRDGYAQLFARHDAAGALLGWDSRNFRFIPPLRMVDDLRKDSVNALFAFYQAGQPDRSLDDLLRARLTDTQIVEWRTLALDADGQVRETIDVLVREPRGELLITSYDVSKNQLYRLDPPLLLLPADLGPDVAWSSEGSLDRGIEYHFQGHVVGAGAFAGSRGSFDDCLNVESRYTLTRAGVVFFVAPSSGWYCVGVGAVAAQFFDASGATTTRLTVVSGDGLAPEAAVLPGTAMPAAALATVGASSAHSETEPANPADWELTRIGRARPTGTATESTIPPLWLPTDPPIVLAAGQGGDLIAFDAQDRDRPVHWRFHPDGSIYGPPAFDSAGGRIYFGATDRRLYALDARGLYLWSFPTGDNVAGRPLVVGDTVVFGSEDRIVYGLNAATGELRWSAPTRGAIVSSPALVGEPGSDKALVVIGSDDRGIYGINPMNGEQRRLATLDEAIEAPIVVDGPRVYIAARDGSVSALVPAECVDTCQPTWTASVGGVLRTAPALGAERVFVVTSEGQLVALDRDDGRRLWRDQLGDFVGPPVLVGDTLVVLGRDGTIHRLDQDGTRLGTWPATAASSPVDRTPAFALGPTVGGEAVWSVDTDAVVRRLGPRLSARDGVDPLSLAWFLRSFDPPFNQTPVTTTVAEYRDRAVVVDFAGRITLIDPTTSRWERRGLVPAETSLIRLDPVVAANADTLLVIAADTLHAVSLADGSARWQFPSGGAPLRPPAVVGDTVLWVTAPTGDLPEGSRGRHGTLHALDIVDGTLRWQAAVGPFRFPGGVIADGDTAFVSSPPHAVDVATGQVRFQAQVPGLALGGPALSEAGDTLYVASLDGDRGVIIALDTNDGSPRWLVDLGDGEQLSNIERLWLSDDTLVIASFSGKVIGLDSATGAERWRHAPDAPRLGTLNVADGRVWQVLDNGRVYALDAQNGRPALRYTELELNLTNAGLAQRPAVVRGRLIAPIGTMLLAFDVLDRGDE